MGWQKKSSGRRFDSLSDHAFFIGLVTKKIIGVILFCNSCQKCSKAALRGVTVEEYLCPKKCFGAWKSMEADVVVLLITELFNEYNKKVFVQYFLDDNDSTTRSLLVKPEDKNKGKLPLIYPKDIIFWADINHWIKYMVIPLFALAQVPNSISSCTKGDALCIKRNFGWYFCTTQKRNSFDTFINNTKTPIMQHFHQHDWCDESWCPFKYMNTRQLECIIGQRRRRRVLLITV